MAPPTSSTDAPFAAPVTVPTGAAPAPSAAPTVPVEESATPAPVATPPPWGFGKGLLVGAIVEIPLFATAVWLAGRAGMVRQVDYMHLVRLTTLFAGIAMWVTAGGVGRSAAWASIRGKGGRRRAILVAAGLHAIAGLGIVTIIGVASETIGISHQTWVPLGAAGLLAGAIAGVCVGAMCGGASPIAAQDLLELAKKPTDALGLAIDQGSKLSRRATKAAGTLVEGLFDPAGPRASTETETAQEQPTTTIGRGDAVDAPSDKPTPPTK